MKRLFGLILISGVAALLLGGCTQSALEGSGLSSPATGTLQIRVTDAPPGYEITGVVVTVNSVEVHRAIAEQDRDREQEQQQIQQGTESQTREQDRDREHDRQGTPNAGKGKGNDQPKGSPAPATGIPTPSPSEEDSDAVVESDGATAGWVSIPIRPGSETFDLLKLQGVEEILAVSELDPGTYTQIRMGVEKIEVRYTDSSGTHVAQAELPSGKLKFVRPFAIEAGKITTLTFDFIASKSVVFTGSEKVIFKPVIKLKVSEPKTPPLRITTESLSPGTVGAHYQARLLATGGTLPYTWGVASGTLPNGLALHPTEGTISGTPTAPGTWSFAVRVSDNSVPVQTATGSFTLPIIVPSTPEAES